MQNRTCFRAAAGALLAVVPLLLPGTLQAQDFLFGRPHVTVSLFGGWAAAGEASDPFEFAREHVTLDDDEFDSPLVLAELAYRAAERLDLTVGVEHSSRTVDSEMRHYLTMDDQPITQSNRFARTRFQAGAKAYLLPRGRAIGQLSWVPNRWSPYVGGGIGLTWYEFSQVGDFVDFQNLFIFYDEIEETGYGWTPHALAGLQVSLTPRFLLRGEYRYIWGSGEPRDTDFSEGFDHHTDLSGSRAMLGVSIRL